MSASVPKIIKNFNLFVGTQGLAGLVSKVTMPEFKLKVDDHRAGGLDSPMPIDMGMEKMELKMEMAEHTLTVMQSFGLGDQKQMQGTLRMAQSDNAQNVQPYIIEFHGLMHTVTSGDAGSGEKNMQSATVQCTYIKVSLNNAVVYEIDVPNMIRNVGGVDQLAAQRAALNI